MTDRGRHDSPEGRSGRQPHDVTLLLRRWSAGDREALEELAPLVEAELRRVAHAHLARERPHHTLDTGALVNEAYRRLLEDQEKNGPPGGRSGWEGRAHFVHVAARVMRHILVDYARRKNAVKRAVRAVPLDEERDGGGERSMDPESLLSVHEALGELEKLDPRQGRIVELMFFGGLTGEEIAGTLDVSPATVKRQWRVARAWLLHRMTGVGP